MPCFSEAVASVLFRAHSAETVFKRKHTRAANLGCKCFTGNTALITAVRGAHVSTVEFLLRNHADPLLGHTYGCSAVHMAQVRASGVFSRRNSNAVFYLSR